MDPDSSLTDLFRNALTNAGRASNLPTIEEDTQVTFFVGFYIRAVYTKL